MPQTAIQTPEDRASEVRRQLESAQTPCEKVLAVFHLGSNHKGEPLIPTPMQAQSVNQFGRDQGHGCWDKPGTGKTLTMTLHALLAMLEGRQKQAVILTPPTVIDNWAKFLRGIRVRASGQPLAVLEYRGGNRQKHDLHKFHFIIMSYEIFKRDFERLSYALVEDNPNGVMLICDEGHKLKNMASKNFKAACTWRNAGVPIRIATGTPTTTPADIFTYTRFKNPEAYRNAKHFLDLHLLEEDGYGNPVRWGNLELARKHHMTRATEVLLSDVRPHLPAVTVDEWGYDLAPEHARLYKKLAQEQLLVLEESGEEITALNASALYHKCQQIVLNLDHFTGKPDARSVGVQLAEQWLDELGDEKLVIVANYQMSNALLHRALAPWGAEVLYGPMSYAAKMRAKDRFISDPACRVLVMQPEAGGVGVDGLQHVCHAMLFLEAPCVSRQYRQAVARLERTGQEKPVQVRIAVARGTVQVKGYRSLLANEDLVAQMQRTPATLRQMVFGA